MSVLDGHRLSVGAAVPDVKAARAAAEAASRASSFFVGFPGRFAGLRMNAGAYGGETKDALVEAHGVTRRGEHIVFSNADMGFSYRHSGAPRRCHFYAAQYFRGGPGDSATILAEMERIAAPARPRSRIARRPAARPSRIRRDKGLAIDRRGGMSRAGRRRCAGERDALQFSDQSRRGHRGGHRGARRGSARARAGAKRDRASWEIKRIGERA